MAHIAKELGQVPVTIMPNWLKHQYPTAQKLIFVNFTTYEDPPMPEPTREELEEISVSEDLE